MASNTFTKGYADGSALTESHLDTALQSLKTDLTQTTQLTNGSTSGQFLKSTGAGVAASWAAIPDPLGPNLIRNYGIIASAAAGVLTFRLKTQTLSDASTTDVINIPFSSNGSTSATHTDLTVAAALSVAVNASATLGFTTTNANNVYLYAVNNAGTVRLAVSGRGSFDGVGQITTVALSASADNPNILYATAAFTVIPRLMGWATVAHNAANAWQASSKVNVGQIAPNGQGAIVIAASSGTATTLSTTYADVAGQSISITTTGRPVRLELIPITSAGSSSIKLTRLGGSTTAGGHVQFTRAAAGIGEFAFGTILTGGGSNPFIEYVGLPSMVDFPPAGTHTYSFQARVDNGTNTETVGVTNVQLMAYEL